MKLIPSLLLPAIFFFNSGAGAALSLPRTVQCKATLEGPVIKVQFSKIPLASTKFTVAQPPSDQGYGGAFDECLGTFSSQTTMTINNQIFVNSESPVLVKTDKSCLTQSGADDFRYVEMAFKSQEVPTYRVTMRLWNTGLLTLEAGSTHAHYDCSIAEAY